MRIYGAPSIVTTEPDPTPPDERLRQLADLTAFACRSMVVLLELQRMAADSYAKQADYRDLFVETHERIRRMHQCDADLSVRAGLDAQAYLTSAQISQLVAAVLSRLVRAGLGIEPPEGT